jgi:hypothetical protein
MQVSFYSRCCNLAIVGLALLCGGSVNAQFSDLKNTYRFLVSDRKTNKGALYAGTAGDLNGAWLPLSFYDSPQYWGLYVCTGENFPCVVTDTYDSASFALKPEQNLAGDLQTERVNVHNGANIYDAATWQIAVMLGDVVNKFGNTTKQSGRELAQNQNRLLSMGYYGNAQKTDLHAIRAATQGETFIYNGQPLKRDLHAYAFRMIPRDWLSIDPLSGSIYAAWITAKELPALNTDYRRGKITWSDWKPVTGENAWAFLLGPLHAAYIHYVLHEHGTFVPYRDLAIQNALAILPTFAAMQSPIGAVYYAPAGTLSNQGKQLVNPHQVAIENNFSLYAGLKVLNETLRATLKNDGSLTNEDKAAINTAFNIIDVMIRGGTVGGNKRTEGLLAFFKTKAWRNGEFIQGGLANDPNQKLTWVPTVDPQAVDVITWGVAALGPKTIDEWFGAGAAYNSWQQLKTWGAYGVDKTLWGVGYSNQDGNGINLDGTYKQGVLSSEWTAGAINMLRSMIHYYKQAKTTANATQTDAYVAKLKEDELAMLAGVQRLRFDNYVKTQFPGKPQNYSRLITQSSGSYLYASKRYPIPFGWYANPIPSTCSTAWIIMLADDFDPFTYGGRRN